MMFPKEVYKTKTIWGWQFSYRRRSSKELWGRFGGGWNWNLGFQQGGRTLLVHLLVCSVTVSKVVAPKPTPILDAMCKEAP